MRKVDRLTMTQSALASVFVMAFRQAEQEVQNFTINQWIDIFDLMVQDETIDDAADKYSSIVAANIVTYKHENKEIEKFVLDNFKFMNDSLVDIFKTAIIDMNNYGYHVSEIVYQYNEKDKKLYFKKFVRIPPSIVRFNVNKHGDITSVHVYGNETIRILPDKLFIAINGKENGFYGKSKLRKAYRWWKVKKHLVEFWAIALEKYAVPPLVAKTPQQNQETVLEQLSKLYSDGAMVIDPESDVTTVEGRRDFPELFDRALKTLNTMIYRAYLLPVLLGDTQSTGSYALGKIQMEPFYTSTRIAAEALTYQFVNTAIRSLLEVNGYPSDDLGSFVVLNEPSSEEKWRIGQLIYQLTQVGYLNPEEDNEWVRTMLRFAQRSDANGK